MKTLVHLKLQFALAVIVLFAAAAEGQNFNVTCGSGTTAGLHTISAAIALIANLPNVGPHTITVTGACQENVNIIFLDYITLQAGPGGASITDASGGNADTLLVLGSRQFSMFGFTINGSFSCTNDAVCRTHFNTFQNGSQGYGIRYSRSHGDTDGDVIQNSNGIGVSVQNASRVILADSTVVQGNAGDGVQVREGSYLILAGEGGASTIANNGNNGVLVDFHGTVRVEAANIMGNGNNGVMLLGNSVLQMNFASPNVNTISGNGAAGVHVGDQSFAGFPSDGSASVIGNFGGTDVVCSGQFSATRGALTNIGGGTTNCKEPRPL